MTQRIEMAGQTFGFLQVIEHVGWKPGDSSSWKCLCLRCGGLHVARSYYLRTGRSTQCRKCRLKELSQEKRALTNGAPRSGRGRPPKPCEMTYIEKSYRKMLAAKEYLEVNNNIRLNNFTEVRLYDQLIRRDVDKISHRMAL
ncbi:hypothetical protein [Novacetimonas hansenii]|uniref:hypothetical protein n=1 Tax=Novacetimonas hansenii TaxID=436 RepID=UPI00248DB080|nr:hypothetical protein [Novacetimonas hansenii]